VTVTLVNGKTISLTVLASTNGVTAIYMKASGRPVSAMVKAVISLPVVTLTLVSTVGVRLKAMDSISGGMATSILVNFTTV